MLSEPRKLERLPRRQRGSTRSNRNAGFLGKMRMRQAIGGGTIRVLERPDAPKERVGKGHRHVHGREQEDLLAAAGGSLRPRRAGVGGRVTGSRLRQPCSRRPRAQPRPEAIKEIVRAYHSAFPAINFTVKKQVAEGDMVVTRWIARGTHRGEFMGVPPSGRRIEVSGMSIDRISGGRIVEDWNNWVALEMMR
jgi:hypothetical protein